MSGLPSISASREAGSQALSQRHRQRLLNEWNRHSFGWSWTRHDSVGTNHVSAVWESPESGRSWCWARLRG
ncbi:hypothetical protein [Synechococcus sp. MIT S9509]|uniref:hypothetical protein n=1 Tax=Synechococcus sp. MIT S9509 TaxID=1801630 RepID=UPI0039AF8AA5